MHAFGPEADAFPPRGDSQPRASGSGERRAVPEALIIDLLRGIDLRFVPAGIALDWNAGGADDLIVGQIERHIVGGELAVELSRGIEGMVLPSVLVVHHDFRIPLREVEAPALTALTARQRRKTRLPLDFDHERIAGHERPGERPVRDRRVGRVRVVGSQLPAHERGGRDPLERVVRIHEVLKPLALLGGVGGGPARPRPERVQVLMHVEVAQRGRGAVDVADPLPPRQHAGRLVEGRGDAVADLLLPVARRVAGQKKKKEGRERWHKDREATQRGARRGGRARLRCRARDSDAGRASDAGHLRPPSQTSTKESPCCPIPHAWPHPRRSPCSWAGSPVPFAPRVQDPRRARAPDRPVPLPRPPPLPRNSWRADSRSRWATPRSALAYAPSSIARRTASISCHSSGSSPPTAGSPSRRWRAAPGGPRPLSRARPTAPSRSRCTCPCRRIAARGPGAPTCSSPRRSPTTMCRWRSTCTATAVCSTPNVRPRPPSSRWSRSRPISRPSPLR